jgi:hypothetical protein
MNDNIKMIKSLTEVYIYAHCASFPGGRAYLCADGSLSSERREAAAHWNIQFAGIVAENWILTASGPTCMEPTGAS